MSDKNKKLEEMKNLEDQKTKQLQGTEEEVQDGVLNEELPEEVEESEEEESEEEDTNDVYSIKPKKLKKAYNVVNGFRTINKKDLPFGGKYYPENWEIVYRCPTTEEVANFSTIDETDRPKIISGIEELIVKCYKIIDREKQQEVPSNQINDGERLFYFLKLREYYMHDKPIEFLTISQHWNETVLIKFVADGLTYKTPSQKLLDCFDGRMFTFAVPKSEKEIKFLIPTIDISSRIFRYMIKKYTESQKESNDNIKESETFNKQFLFMAPFLYTTGTETVESLKAKFKKIKEDANVYSTYITIINKLNITNNETLTYTYKGIEEESQMKFPGGWKNVFVNKETFGDMFD